MKATVVVPTFNRGAALVETIRLLAASEVEEGDAVEIVVVDDGSRIPAQEVAAASGLEAQGRGWPVQWIRQENAGPAAARNAGFRAGDGEVVLFVDDDILVPPGLVSAHLQGHRKHPGAVIFGLCPYAPEREATPFRAYLDSASDSRWRSSEEWTQVPTVASGQLSVARAQFAPEGGVYCSDLAIPAAEEFELAFRLQQRGIPILRASTILAVHDQPVEVRSYCREQYKHGVGCGEVAAKQPELLSLPALGSVIEASIGKTDPSRPSTYVRRALKTMVSRPSTRRALLLAATAQESLPLPARLRALAYRAAIAAHFLGGVRDGMARFGPESAG